MEFFVMLLMAESMPIARFCAGRLLEVAVLVLMLSDAAIDGNCSVGLDNAQSAVDTMAEFSGSVRSTTLSIFSD